MSGKLAYSSIRQEKLMIMQSQLDIRESQGNTSLKFKRSMRLLLKDMAGLKGSLGPKRGLGSSVPNEKGS